MAIDQRDRDKELWTVQELAQKAGVTDGYIRRLLIDGELKGEKFGTQWMIRRREVERFLRERGKSLD
jgi:excisionase family DNA binding protein